MPFLPQTRPASSSFGDDLENDKPVADPTKELDATNWNAVKEEVAQIASTTPLAVVRITNNGSTATVAKAMGLAAASITATRTGAGVVSVVFDGLVIEAATVTAIATDALASVTFTAGSNTVIV